MINLQVCILLIFTFMLNLFDKVLSDRILYWNLENINIKNNTR